MSRLQKILRPQIISESARMTKLCQFLQGHPKTAFCKKSAKGGPREIFQNRPKNSARLKGPHALAQMPLTSKLYALKFQRLEKILAQKRLQNCPNGQVMSIFSRSPKTRIF